MESVDLKKARAWLEEQLGKSLRPREVNSKVDNLLREFILTGGFNVQEYISIQKR